MPPEFHRALIGECARNHHDNDPGLDELSGDGSTSEIFASLPRFRPPWTDAAFWCCPRKEFIKRRRGRPMTVSSSQVDFFYRAYQYQGFPLRGRVIIFWFSVVSRAAFQRLREYGPASLSSIDANTPALLVGIDSQLRAVPEMMHDAFSNSEETPILPEEGERVARELRAAKYMECETGNVDHLRAVIQEALRLGWNDAQERMTGTFWIYRAKKWLTSKWSSLVGIHRL
ncbi:hypothetical protein SISSUDRAFT_1053980 [Sistotremastrum suecicum HHB10207 ss-3]|uniref:Uncharacterized protein n=1 Tax=Sistotremastrum suecicum HHB10207 ss-3 TaxID=1314776 RepID=A0A165YVR5_9AGAM|nr:hypothetical protein SISSUDRAFT_1053980 [Sistotremastrum suecicum HHB10207 ss-3]